MDYPDVDRHDLRRVGRRALTEISEIIGAGPAHRRRLDRIDTRIVVMGVRGKSTTVRWLHDVFHRRGFDTFAKVTGDQPLVLYNGAESEITRPDQTRLYENERELGKVGDVDVAIFENQGIRQYTTRLVNERFAKPHVVFITNIREDHLDTLGRNRMQIARALARAVPEGAAVVSGEQNPVLREYLETQLDRRNVPVTHVDIPQSDRLIPGAECVYGLDAVLEAVDQPHIPADERRSKLDSMDVEWRRLPNGLIHNAAMANDVQSTDLIRRSLIGDSETVIEPLLYLRHDRRGRTASFLRYLDGLIDRGAAERVHVIGEDRRLFERNASFPVVSYDTNATTPDELLDRVLSADRPVLVMGNSVNEFMHELEGIIDDRALDETAEPPIQPEARVTDTGTEPDAGL